MILKEKRLKELNQFSTRLEVLHSSDKNYDSKNSTFFFSKKKHDSKNWTLFKNKMTKNGIFWKTLRTELFWTLLEELNQFYYVFKNSTPFFQ